MLTGCTTHAGVLQETHPRRGELRPCRHHAATEPPLSCNTRVTCPGGNQSRQLKPRQPERALSVHHANSARVARTPQSEKTNGASSSINPLFILGSGQPHPCRESVVSAPISTVIMTASPRQAPHHSNRDRHRFQSGGVDREYGLEQHVRSVHHVRRFRKLIRRMTDAADGWHEDHARRSDRRHVLSVVPSATG